MRLFPLLVCLAASIGVSARGSFADDDGRFEALHERAREREASLVTLRADFVETTESSLLVDALVSRGRLIAVRPLRLRLDYVTPEPRTLLIEGDTLRVIWPERGEREALSIGDIRRSVDKYFTGASAKQMRGHFDIDVQVDPTLPGTHHLLFRPKRKQIRESLQLLELWLAEATLDMVKLRMVYAGGDRRTIELSNLRVNEDIDESEFTQGIEPESGETPARDGR